MVVLIAWELPTLGNLHCPELVGAEGISLSVDRPAENGTDSKRTDQLIPGG